MMARTKYERRPLLVARTWRVEYLGASFLEPKNEESHSVEICLKCGTSKYVSRNDFLCGDYNAHDGVNNGVGLPTIYFGCAHHVSTFETMSNMNS